MEVSGEDPEQSHPVQQDGYEELSDTAAAQNTVPIKSGKMTQGEMKKLRRLRAKQTPSDSMVVGQVFQKSTGRKAKK